MEESNYKDYGQRHSEYADARERIRALLNVMIERARLSNVEVVIDRGRAALWEGLHEVTFRTPHGTHNVLLQHNWFMDPGYLKTYGVPLFQDAIDKVRLHQRVRSQATRGSENV